MLPSFVYLYIIGIVKFIRSVKSNIAHNSQIYTITKTSMSNLLNNKKQMYITPMLIMDYVEIEIIKSLIVNPLLK